MIRLKYGFLAFIVATALFTGCAKPPLEEMNNAVAAVNRAENDPDVVNYAANALARAREALTQMQAEADAKRYDNAKRLAADAQALAEKAVSDSRAAALRIRDEADSAIRAMQSSLSETEQTLNDARRSHPAGVNIDRLDQDFANARGTADQAVIAQTESRYREAIDKSQTVRAALSAITSSLSQTVIAASRKK
ncbi:MAG: DUF4398 domain-containing protein [Spirochaetaceae bacterium]|jgi:uncharacterized membrane protein YccC|nr:DUF4398 domain-containing protein [Spirochaetaceae bacterium]